MALQDQSGVTGDILVVDDDDAVIRWMTAVLSEAGYTVRRANDGPQALSSARATPPALVLLDVGLPGIDGYDVCRGLKADPTTAAVPVIFVSGSLTRDDHSEAFEAGGVDYITKPILRKELLARVHTHLSIVRAHQAAQAERDQLHAVLLAAPAAFFVVDENGRVVHINPAAARLFGAGADTSSVGGLVGCALRNNDTRACGFAHPCGPCRLGRTVRHALTGQAVHGREMELDLPAIDASGRRCIIANAEPLLLDGRPAAVIALEDVTERKRVAREREHLQASLTQADRLASMGMLAAGVAHEVNNPLSYVLFNLESLVEDLPKLAAAIKRCRASVMKRDSGATLAEFAGEGVELLGEAWLDDAVARSTQALDGVRRIRAVVRGLGTFSRVEDVKLSRTDVSVAMESAISMARNEIKYRARLVKDLGEATEVLASQGKLAQIFLNLLVNSAHAIGEGNIDGNQISVRIWTEGGDVFIEVADTGCGIPPQYMARVFDPFFTSKSTGKGSGLGLAICRNLVTEFGGHIRIESEVGEGTRVVVRLPAVATPASVLPFPIAGALPPLSGVSGRLMVVDDEPAIRAVMKRILGGSHDVVAAASGAEARAILERDPSFDVILCDLMMPDMTGMDLHRWLSGHNAILAAKMVFVTGGAYTPSAAEYLAAAGNLRIEKPFDAKDVKRLVAQLILATRSTS